MKSVIIKYSMPRRRVATGATLLVCLILMSLLALLGLGSMETIVLQEKMSAIMSENSAAFNRAEAALRYAEDAAEAEADAAAGIPQGAGPGFPAVPYDNSWNLGPCPDPADNLNQCTNGRCMKPAKACVSRWENSAFTGWFAVPSGDLPASMGSPEFFIEYLGNTFSCDGTLNGATFCRRYRITARSGTPVPGQAQVVLQSIYATD